MEEDKLNRIIRQKLENQVPPYQEGFWEQASAQMDLWEKEEKRRKVAPFWWWMLGLSLFLGSGTFLGFSYLNKNNAPIAASELLGKADSCAVVSVIPTTIETETTVFSSKTSPNQSDASRIKKSSNLQPKIEEQQGKQKVLGLAGLRPVSQEEKSPIEATAPEAVPITQRKNLRTFLQGPLGPKEMVLSSHIEIPASDRISGSIGFPNRPTLSIILSRGSWEMLVQNQENREPNAWKRDFAIGSEWMIPLKKRLYLQSGLHYVSQPLKGIQLQSEGQSFSFSLQENKLNWKPVQASSLWMPVRAGIFLGPRHRIEGGLVLQYLLGTRGEAISQRIDGFGNQTQQTETLNGISYGMRRWGVATQIAYKVHLKGRLHAGLQYHYDLRDLTRNDAFQLDQFDANRGFRLTLEYILR